MSKFIAIGLLSSLGWSLAIPVQAQHSIDGIIWDQIHKQQRRDMIRKHGGDICYTILSSSWRHYQRQRAAGSYSYPSASDIRWQRKVERENGCPHLYNEDGSVNSVQGVNANSSSSESSLTPAQTEECSKYFQEYNKELNSLGASMKSGMEGGGSGGSSTGYNATASMEAMAKAMNAAGECIVRKGNYSPSVSPSQLIPEEIVGVGIQLTRNESTQLLTVAGTINGGSAAAAGMLPNDIITEIERSSTDGMSIEQAVKLIRGPIDSRVMLTVSRNGQPLLFLLKRTRLVIERQQ